VHEAGEGGLAERTAKEAIFLSNWTTLKSKPADLLASLSGVRFLEGAAG